MRQLFANNFFSLDAGDIGMSVADQTIIARNEQDGMYTMRKKKTMQKTGGQVKRDAKFQRILDAALHVFVQKGFHHAKISDIARTAGVADGTIYLYFKNKEDLLASLYDVNIEALAKKLDCETQTLPSSHEKLAHVVDFHLQLAKKQAALLALVRHEIHAGHGPWGRGDRAEPNAYLAQWVRTIQEGIDDGSFSGDTDATALVHLVYGAIDYACSVWSFRPQPHAQLDTAVLPMRQFLLQVLNIAP